jgi:DNA-binding XRE family transcriptional regulator
MIDGKKLRAFREKRGVTQAQLAKELGITKQSITAKERGGNGPDAAEAYLNACLKLSGRRETVRLNIALDYPMGGMRTDLLPDLLEVIS